MLIWFGVFFLFFFFSGHFLLLFSHWVNSFVTPWTVAHQAPLSMGFPGQEYWSGLPFPSPGDLPDLGIKPVSPALAGRFFTTVRAGSVVSSSCDPIDCSPPGSSVHGISQARILEWVAISFFRASSPPRDWTQVSCTAGRFFTTNGSWKPLYHWATHIYIHIPLSN